MENVIYKISLKSSINRRERGGGEERNLNRLLKNKISLLELL